MKTEGRITVLLVDDHDGVRGLLKDYLNDQPGIQVVADTKDGSRGVKLACEVAPTVAVVDISMRDPDGVTVCRNITASGQGVKVVALTWHSDRSFVPQVLAAGASGYVLKRSASTELVAAIRAVAAGEIYVDGAVRVTQPGPSQRSAPAVLPDGMLDAKEVHVLRLVAEGRSNLEIAKELEVYDRGRGPAKSGGHGQGWIDEPSPSCAVRGSGGLVQPLTLCLDDEKTVG